MATAQAHKYSRAAASLSTSLLVDQHASGALIRAALCQCGQGLDLAVEVTDIVTAGKHGKASILVSHLATWNALRRFFMQTGGLQIDCLHDTYDLPSLISFALQLLT